MTFINLDCDLDCDLGCGSYPSCGLGCGAFLPSCDLLNLLAVCFNISLTSFTIKWILNDVLELFKKWQNLILSYFNFQFQFPIYQLL